MPQEPTFTFAPFSLIFFLSLVPNSLLWECCISLHVGIMFARKCLRSREAVGLSKPLMTGFVFSSRWWSADPAAAKGAINTVNPPPALLGMGRFGKISEHLRDPGFLRESRWRSHSEKCLWIKGGQGRNKNTQERGKGSCLRAEEAHGHSKERISVDFYPGLLSWALKPK